jgi:hypothetical protein
LRLGLSLSYPIQLRRQLTNIEGSEVAQLLKPDMPAVLERTHLAAHFDAFLLPVYEAGSNAIHSLLDRYGATNVAQAGKLVFSFSIGTTAEEYSVTISDNGDGLNAKNYAAFPTPFTGNKLRRGAAPTVAT